jgi:predicted ATPase
MKPHLEKIEILKDFRTLKGGSIIDFKPITLLVGEQGCGKSTILTLLRDNSDYLKLTLSESTIKNSIDTFYFDTEKMNPRISGLDNYTTPNGISNGIGIGGAIVSHFKSHGEVLREFTVNRIDETTNCVLFLDEPESALSLRNQYLIADKINKATERNTQLIIATHCLPLIESVDGVFNVEEMKWMKSKDFIKKSKNI